MGQLTSIVQIFDIGENMKNTKRLLAFLLLFVSIVAYAENYAPSVIFSKVSSKDIITSEGENYKLGLLENNIVGFADGTQIVGTWTVETRVTLGTESALPSGFTLTSGLYYSGSQQITFASTGGYTTTGFSLYSPTSNSGDQNFGSDKGNWLVSGNILYIVNTKYTVSSGRKAFICPINKVSNYEWSAPKGDSIALYFSKPDAPPRVPINLTADITGSGIELNWEYNYICDGFAINRRIDTIDAETGYWVQGAWQSSIQETDSAIKQALVEVGNAGKYLFSVQAFKINGADKIYSPLGGGNTRSIIIQ